MINRLQLYYASSQLFDLLSIIALLAINIWLGWRAMLCALLVSLLQASSGRREQLSKDVRALLLLGTKRAKPKGMGFTYGE